MSDSNGTGVQVSDPLPIQRMNEGLFVWQATVTFTTSMDMPDTVYAEAIARVIKDPRQVLHVEELRRVPNGSKDASGGSR